MVSEQQFPGAVVIAGTEGQLGKRLAALYSDMGHDVVSLSLQFGADLDGLAAPLRGKPISLLVFADDYSGDDNDAAWIQRADMTTALERLVYTPFRLASLLEPALAEGNGKLVLLSRASAMMEHQNDTGRFSERPFRAAAHALWRCLSIEWRDKGIRFGIVAIDDPQDQAEIELLPKAISAIGHEKSPVTLTDVNGGSLPW